MSSASPRPVGVTVVAVLMIISGVLSVLAGIVSLIGAGGVGTVEVEGMTVTSAEFVALGTIALVLGALNILFAIGILRGSNVVRVIVSILQVLTIGGGIFTLTSGGSLLQAVQSMLFPVLILILLWVGDKTKAFFAR